MGDRLYAFEYREPSMAKGKLFLANRAGEIIFYPHAADVLLRWIENHDVQISKPVSEVTEAVRERNLPSLHIRPFDLEQGEPL